MSDTSVSPLWLNPVSQVVWGAVDCSRRLSVRATSVCTVASARRAMAQAAAARLYAKSGRTRLYEEPSRKPTLASAPTAQELGGEFTAVAKQCALAAASGSLMFDPTYRKWIMELPQGSGKRAPALFRRQAPQARALPPESREAFLIVALRCNTMEAWRQDCKILALKVTPHRLLESLLLPDDTPGLTR